MSRSEGIYNVSIHPRRLVCSWEPLSRGSSAPFSRYRCSMPKVNKPHGLISLKAQKRINNAIDWMLAQSEPKRYFSKAHGKHFKFRVNFLTLTLSAPQIHSDNEIKQRLLNNFLTQLRQKWKVRNYVWRAESQANGNIHFHIVCDKYVPWWQLRHTWNKIQNNLGYVDRFAERHGHHDPNSTDVHKVKKIRNLGGYLAKEISKNSRGAMYTPIKLVDGRYKPVYNPSEAPEIYPGELRLYRVIQGSLWNLSASLSRVRAASLVVYGRVEREMNKIISRFKGRHFSSDWFHVVNVPVKEWSAIADGALLQAYKSHMASLKSGISGQLALTV